MFRRIILAILVVFLCAFTASAYDVITTADNSTIKAIVSEITPTAIKYRKASNPKGPVYTLELEKVKTITYTNGTKDVFNQEEIKTSKEEQDAVAEKPSSQEVAKQPVPAATPQNPTMTDAELLQLYTLNKDKYDNFSDNQTLNLAMEIQKYEKMAKKYKNLAWIGGAMVGSGMILSVLGYGYIFEDTMDDDGSIGLGCAGSVLMAAGIGCTIGWGIKAHKASSKAKEFRSMALFEGNLYESGKQKLAYGVNLFSDRVHHTKALGLSLSYTF